jgi:ribulose-5-phosphate 4-epimerase/fuculose-1-phosphate aldolase
MPSHRVLHVTDSFLDEEKGKTIAEIRELRRRDTALGYRIFGSSGWGSTGDGHISARDPELLDHFWMARYGVAFNQVTVNDIVLVGPNGHVVDAPGGINTGINPAAYLIHWPIHEARPDIIAAAHTHTPYGTPFSTLRSLLAPITQEACGFFENQALFDDEELDIVSLDGGKRIAAAMGSVRSIILANHGLLTSGASVGEAVGWFVTMERVAEAQLKAGAAAKPISAEGARRVAESVNSAESGWHMFQWLVRRHVPDLSVILANS